MDIRRLEVFCKVVELKSFSRAAEASLLTQPTVSEHIRILEAAFGEKLLDRLGREVLPTPAGAIVYRYARRILHLRDEAMQAVESFRGELSGTLLLGASTIPGAYVLPPRIETFHGRHPACRITLRISGSERIAQEIVSGQIEMGIIGARPRDAAMEAEELFGDELLLALWPGHPWEGRGAVSPGELTRQPFILRESGSGTRGATERGLREVGVDLARLSLVAEIGSNEAVRECVKGRLGISFLSSLALAEDLRRGTLAAVPVEGVRIRRPFYLVRRRGRELTPLAQAFLDHLRAASPPNAGESEPKVSI